MKRRTRAFLAAASVALTLTTASAANAGILRDDGSPRGPLDRIIAKLIHVFHPAPKPADDYPIPPKP